MTIRHAAAILLLILSPALAAPALAEKPPGVGNGNRGHGNSVEHGNPNSGSVSLVIGERNGAAIRQYYGAEFARGNCPPGLAKKHNGCLPPGQAAKMWSIGRPLPGGVAIYPLPAALTVRLTPPPQGYEYVRVGADILMLAVGTRLVVDALEDLSRH